MCNCCHPHTAKTKWYQILSTHARQWCSKQHMDDFMSQYWGQIQWFTFRPFQSWYLQVVLIAELSATATQTHLNPVLRLTATHTGTHTHKDKKWHKVTCTHTHTCNVFFSFFSNNTKLKTSSDTQGSRDHSHDDWALSLKHQRTLTTHKPNKQNESQNMVTHFVRADIGVCACSCDKRNGWLVWIQKV